MSGSEKTRFITFAHPFWYSTEGVLGIQAKGYEFCYFPLKINYLKSFDMQNIYAIMVGNWALMGT